MGKKKGKKKSKEEIEAERKAREEEEERIRQEELRRQEEEAARLAEEKRIREEIEAKRRAAELALLLSEHEEDQSREAEVAERLQAILEEHAKKEEWEAYMACSHRPDPRKETDLNTYLSEQDEADEPDLSAAMNVAEHTNEVVAELETVLAEATESGDKEKVALYEGFRRKLYSLVTNKVDRATAYWLQHAKEHTERSTPLEARTTATTKCLKYGLWVNLGLKNIRVKNISFNELGIIIDITKPLAVQRVAFRAVHQNYDDAASRAELVKEEAAKFDGIAEVDTGARPGTRDPRGASRAAAKLAKAEEESKGTDGTIDKRGPQRDVPLGGVVYVEMLALPGQPKNVKNWTLHQLTPLSTSVLRQIHPMRHQSGAASSAQAVKVKYTLPPNVIVRDEVPRVAFWDPELHCWSEEQIAEVAYVPETRQVGFHTVELTGFAVIQARHIDFPFSSWSLDPIGDDATLFKVATAGGFHLEIEIAGNKCRLRAPVRPELQHLLGLPLSPGQVVQELARCGIVVSPLNEDAEHVTFGAGGPNPVPKNATLERRTYEDVASLAAAYSIANSRWNQGTGADQTVLRIRENLEFEEEDPAEVHETDWRCVRFELDAESANGFKSELIQALESAEEYNGKACEMEVTHRCVRRTLASRSTPEALDVAAASSPLFHQTVANVLRLFRPLSFC